MARDDCIRAAREGGRRELGLIDESAKQRVRAGFAARFAAVGTALALLGACTTLDGTNAFVDGNTFEREVMTETLAGIGIMGREEKDEIETPRGKLVLPPDSTALPAPVEARTAELPKDSDSVYLDPTGLTEDEIKRIRAGLVVDEIKLEGRPLTAEESRILAERYRQMREARRASQTGANRGLHLPPERLFTQVNNQEFICLTPAGDLVSLDDPACPPEIKAALTGA